MKNSNDSKEQQLQKQQNEAIETELSKEMTMKKQKKTKK